MKNYFSFNQTGKKLLPAWLLFYVVFIAPYIYLIFQLKNIQQGTMPPLYIFPALLLIIVAAFLVEFYIIRFCIVGIGYKDKTLQFSGTLGGFLGTVLIGIFLTMITIGIYAAWFARDIQRFFINHISYDSEPLEFRGTGGRLFVILLLTLLIPLIILSLLMAKFLLASGGAVFLISTNFFYRFIFQSVELIILIPYFYFVYKWAVDFRFKNYIINWQTETMPSLLKLAQELVLMMLTLYIYFPLAMVRLYKYFMDRTVAESTEQKLHFGYDINYQEDFLSIWKEVLLSIVTLGIYFPWAICNIYKRILGKTFTEAV